MIKIVEILCPTCIKLPFNNNQNTVNINQTVDIYDTVNIYQRKKLNKEFEVISKDKISLNLMDSISKAVQLFKNYTNVDITNTVLEIEKNHDLKKLNHDDNIIAGIFLGLNYYFKTNLTSRELFFLGSQINLNVAYFIMGGACYLDQNLKHVTKTKHNPYSNYLLIDSDCYKLHDIKEEESYNSTKRTQIEVFLDKYPDLNHVYLDNDSISLVAFPSNLSIPIAISVKKEFPKVKVYSCRNVNHSTLIGKYENFSD